MIKVAEDKTGRIIHLAKGDTISIRYSQGVDWGNGQFDSIIDEEVCNYTAEKAMVLNYFAVYELEREELEKLGLKCGYSATLGEKDV